jgi:23S rRNA (cytidine1920-2'-O)/16S rRNA (cytidine1409-2'-O)-methyltransferase
VGSGGVVRDPDAWRDAILGVADAGSEHGLSPIAVMASPLPGAAGNIEFPLHARVGSAGAGLRGVDGALEEARAIAGVPS